MPRQLASVDIATMPDLARLAREVATTGRSCVLRQDGTDVAILSPARPRRRPRHKKVTEDDIRASLAAVGSWKSRVDTEQLKRDLDAARGDNRPPVEL